MFHVEHLKNTEKGDTMDEYYLKEALKLAKTAAKHGDVPVGAIIVENNKIISKSYNKKEKQHSVISHAEINAISKACKKKKSNYLNNCTLYVTLEPCMMCTGAILQSHIKRVVYCTRSPKYGYMSKLLTDSNVPRGTLSNKIEIVENILEKESSDLLVEFFKPKR